MNEEFKAFGGKAWAVTDDALIYGREKFPFSELSSINLVTTPTTPLTNGVAQAVQNGKVCTLAFKYADKARAHSTIEFIKAKIDEAHGVTKNYKYKLLSHTGSSLEVYDDYVILYFMPVGSLLGNIARGGVTGGKKIAFSEITSIQFKEPAGMSVGFIQFSYAGSAENKGGVIAAVNDENSITFQPNQLPLAQEIVSFIEKRRDEVNQSAQAAPTVIQQTSAADELKKFKELLDSGIITQEEFDAKKKQLLGL